jgi:hypothetical protein
MDFHRCCDGHGNTLTLIQSKEEPGYVSRLFGGFTPVLWESTGDAKGELNGVGSFLFHLNPSDNGGPRRYPLLPSAKGNAIFCRHNYGPTFGNPHDLHVCNDCNTNRGV